MKNERLPQSILTPSEEGRIIFAIWLNVTVEENEAWQ